MQFVAEPIRTSFRRQVRLQCEVVREHDFRLVGDLVLDASTTGLRCRATRRVLTGEELIVAMRMPGTNIWFDAAGVVSRVIHGRRPGDDGLAFGVELLDLDPSRQAFLFQHLRGANAPNPQRPPRPLAS